MIDNNNNIENNLQTWMQQQTEVEIDFAWADMKEKLQEKKKRRFIFWWWLFGGLLLLGLAGVLFYYNSVKSKQQTTKKAVEKAQKLSNLTEKNTKKAEELSSLAEKNTKKAEELLPKAEKKLNISEKNIKNMGAKTTNLNENTANSIKKVRISSKKIENSSENFKQLSKDGKAKDKKAVIKKEEKSNPDKTNKQENKLVTNKKTKENLDINRNENKTNLADDKIQSLVQSLTNENDKKDILVNKKDSAKKQDSTPIVKKPETKLEKPKTPNKFKLGGGLDWNLPLPVTKSEYFFTGKNLKPNVLNYFIPSIFTNVTYNEKHTLLIGFTPFSQYNLPTTTYNVVEGSWSKIEPKIINSIDKFDSTWAQKDTSGKYLIDSSTGGFIINPDIEVIKKSNLNKAFGYGIYVDYLFTINKHWQVGVGGTYNAITSYINTNNVKRTNAPSSIQKEFNNNDTALLSPSESNGKINNSFMSAKASVIYNLKRFSFGANVTVPFDGVNKEGEVNKAPIFNILLRLKLF